MSTPTYTNPKDPDFNNPLNFIVPLSDKDLPDEEYDNNIESEPPYCGLCRNEDCDGYCDCPN